jgi:enoyl-CoA hydratase/carnithine racemase
VPDEQNDVGASGATVAPGEREVLVERRQDGIALVTLNRPKANALSTGLLALLAETIADLTDPAPGALVIWGGDRIFAAGADVSEFSEPDAPSRVADSFRAVTDALVKVGCPSIAAISGYALGGGLELAMGCDFRIASPKSRLGQPEILLGIIPGGGGTQRLSRLVGPSRAKDLIMTGRQIGAAEALGWGLVDRVTSENDVLTEALAFAGQLAAGPAIAIRASKRLVDEGLDTDLEAGLAMERAEFVEVLATEDAKRGIKSFFESGPGKATFVGR